MHRITLCSLILFLTLLVSCSSLPDDLKKKIDGLSTSITNSEKLLVDAEVNYLRNVKGSKDYAFLEPYAKRESWELRFDTAAFNIERAKDLKVVLDSLKEENEEKDIALTKAKLESFSVNLKQVRALSRFPSHAAQRLLDALKNAPAMEKSAKKTLLRSGKSLDSLKRYSGKQTANHPKKKEAISKLMLQVDNRYTQEKNAVASATSQFKSSSPDYAVFVTACDHAKDHRKRFVADASGVRKQLGELDRDYSKVLIDQWSDYYILVGRTSWNNSSDGNTEKEYPYKARRVVEAVYEYYASLPENQVLADYSEGWGDAKFSPKINATHWATLKISPKEGWPSKYHGHAEFWIGDLPAKYYHKYVMITSNLGQSVAHADTVVEEVSEDFFENHWDDLGMAIVTKEFGIFESEAIKAATPPGMNMVGDKRYGEWQTDPKYEGGRRWSFFDYYIMYSILSPNRYYSGYDHGYYRSNYYGRSYYGSDRRANSYGTSSASAKSRYSGSKFNKSGGFKAASASARGTRGGGGPGSRGK